MDPSNVYIPSQMDPSNMNMPVQEARYLQYTDPSMYLTIRVMAYPRYRHLSNYIDPSIWKDRPFSRQQDLFNSCIYLSNLSPLSEYASSRQPATSIYLQIHVYQLSRQSQEQPDTSYTSISLSPNDSITIHSNIFDGFGRLYNSTSLQYPSDIIFDRSSCLYYPYFKQYTRIFSLNE